MFLQLVCNKRTTSFMMMMIMMIAYCVDVYFE